SEFITPIKDQERGWRKTVKITTTNGKKISITTGQGPMFEESFESESELESSLIESSKSLAVAPLSSISTPRIVSNQVPTDISLFDVMISEFNNMSSSPYSSYFSLSKDDEHC